MCVVTSYYSAENKSWQQKKKPCINHYAIRAGNISFCKLWLLLEIPTSSQCASPVICSLTLHDKWGSRGFKVGADPILSCRLFTQIGRGLMSPWTWDPGRASTEWESTVDCLNSQSKRKTKLTWHQAMAPLFCSHFWFILTQSYKLTHKSCSSSTIFDLDTSWWHSL